VDRFKYRLRHSDWRFVAAVTALALITCLLVMLYRP
jgi:hypothetical protein